MRRVLLFKNDDILVRVALRCAADAGFARAVGTIAWFSFGGGR